MRIYKIFDFNKKLISLLILCGMLWIEKEIILANKRTAIWIYFLCELTFQIYRMQPKTNRNLFKIF